MRQWAGQLALGLAVSVAAAYALTAFRFRGRGLVLASVVLAFMVPFEALAIPLADAARTVGLDNYVLGIDDDGLDGGMSISMTAIQLRLYAWARLFWHTYTKDIYGWSSGTMTYTKSL